MAPPAEGIRGPIEGKVTSWSNERGWGIVNSPDAPGDVWVHFSVIEGDGYRSMRPGDAVRFTYGEAPGPPEDLYGCNFMAETAVRITGD